MGAFDTIRFGMMSMHLSSERGLTADFLKHLTLADCAQHFCLPLHRDVRHETLPVTLSEPHPLRQLAQMLTDVMNETGAELAKRGYSGFGAFIIDTVKNGPRIEGRPSAETLVKAAFDTLPAFNDRAVVDGEEVYIVKKAQLMTTELNRKFGKSHPDLFDFADLTEISVAADNVIPCMLAHHGLLELSPRLTKMIADLVDLGVGGEQLDVRMRAASVEVCHRVCARARAKLAEVQMDESVRAAMDTIALDCYMWTVGKDTPELRSVTRPINRQTVYY
ncbi:hypothetical protein HK101_006785 [Irineochytrium annulatum]|nr:hypothetical protein HK101_006785 [Irineochytrium annulatum]